MNNEYYKIPYVIMLRKDGSAFSLTRQYELLHETAEQIGRHRIDALIPLAKQSDASWSPTGRGQIPAWARRSNGANSFYCEGFTAYWFTDQFTKGHDKIAEAWEKPSFEQGVTYHYPKVKTITDAVARAKKKQRLEITKAYRKEFGCKKPFFSCGEIRFYITSTDRRHNSALEGWNENWHTAMSFTKKNVKGAIDSFTRYAERESLKGSFQLSLEGQYYAAPNMHEFKYNGGIAWGDFWEVDFIATITL